MPIGKRTKSTYTVEEVQAYQQRIRQQHYRELDAVRSKALAEGIELGEERIRHHLIELLGFDNRYIRKTQEV